MSNEKRFIEYWEIIGSLGSYHRGSLTPDQQKMYDWIMDEIHNAEVVDAVEVVHGRWEWITEDIYGCTHCGATNHVKEVMGQPDYHFCPNCGAKMDGDGNG